MCPTCRKVVSERRTLEGVANTTRECTLGVRNEEEGKQEDNVGKHSRGAVLASVLCTGLLVFPPLCKHSLGSRCAGQLLIPLP